MAGWLDNPANVATATPADKTAAPADVAPKSDTTTAPDGLDRLSDEMGKVNAGLSGQQPQAQPSQPIQNLPAIPPPPTPMPGTYSPEAEQAALRVADSIQDPHSRMRVQALLKQKYANDAMMDGVTQRAREDAKNKAFSDYTTAVYQTLEDKRGSWQDKQAVARKLLETMWKDPRTDYGDARELLEGHMLKIAGMRNTRELGPQFAEAQAAMLDGRISDISQFLKMEQEGGLAPSGTRELIQQFKDMDKPDARFNVERQQLAFKQVAETILREGNEFDPVTRQEKASGKQLLMVTKIQNAILDTVAAAKGDQKEVAKALSTESINDITERYYPKYERDMDRMTKFAAVSVNGIVIPPTVSNDPKSQTAYRDIIAGQQPMSTDKDGKMQAVDQKAWQFAVNAILVDQSQANKDIFRAKFPGKDPDYIIRSINPVAPPPGYQVPSVAPTQETGRGFFGSIFWAGVPATQAPAAAPATPTEAQPGFLGIKPPHEYLGAITKPLISGATEALPNMPTVKRPDQYIREFFTKPKSEEAKK